MTLTMEYSEPEEVPAKPAKKTLFANTEHWVTEWLLPHYRRNPKAVRWDPQWWRHEEVGAVLEAMWGSWESARRTKDATVMLEWFRDVFYPVMDRLTSPNGPFWSYHEALGRVEVPEMLPHQQAPAGWFGLTATVAAGPPAGVSVSQWPSCAIVTSCTASSAARCWRSLCSPCRGRHSVVGRSPAPVPMMVAVERPASESEHTRTVPRCSTSR